MRRKSTFACLLAFSVLLSGCKGKASTADTTAVVADTTSTGMAADTNTSPATRAASVGRNVVINLPKDPTEGMHCYKCFTRIDKDGKAHTDCSEIPCTK